MNGSDDSMELGALLRHHRERAGLTQEGLAERAGLSPQAISALERGVRLRPRRRTINQLVAALDLSRTQHEELVSAACHGWARTRRPMRAQDVDAGTWRVPFGSPAELRLVNVGDEIPSGAVVCALLVTIDAISQDAGEESSTASVTKMSTPSRERHQPGGPAVFAVRSHERLRAVIRDDGNGCDADDQTYGWTSGGY